MAEDRQRDSENVAVSEPGLAQIRRDFLLQSAGVIVANAGLLTTKTQDAIEAIAGQVEVLREAFPAEAAPGPSGEADAR